MTKALGDGPRAVLSPRSKKAALALLAAAMATGVAVAPQGADAAKHRKPKKPIVIVLGTAHFAIPAGQTQKTPYG